MPKHFMSPIPSSELNSKWLFGWDNAVKSVKQAITARKGTTTDLECDNDVTVATCLTKDDN